MPRITERTGSSILELDSDVRLTHYRLQKLGEQQLKLESGEQVALAPVKEAGSGKAHKDEMAPLSQIVEKMNDLFAGGVTEADALGTLTAWSGHLLKNEKLAAQARNNSLEQFVLGDFKEIFTDVVLDAQDGHNKIATQLLKDERIFAAMQGMLAQMVYSAFRRDNAPSGGGV